MKNKYICDFELNTYCCDSNKILKPSGALQALQEAGRKQMAAQKPSYEDILKDGKALMLSRLDMKIYDEVYTGENTMVSSWPCESSRATFLRMYQMTRDDKVVAEISSQWVLVEFETRRILKVEEIDFSNYYMGEYRELIPEKFRISKDMPFEKVADFEVMYSNLDSNKHMNNTYYLDMLCNYIPELADGTHRVETVRTHYSKEAPLGDKLAIMRAKTDNDKYIFKTIKANGEVNIEAEIGVVPVKG